MKLTLQDINTTPIEPKTKRSCSRRGDFTKQDETRRCGSVYLGVIVLGAYVKFVMCMRDMWVVQRYCIFEGLVEMCLITKMMGVVCEVVAVFLHGLFLLDVGKSQTLLIENVCIN